MEWNGTRVDGVLDLVAQRRERVHDAAARAAPRGEVGARRGVRVRVERRRVAHERAVLSAEAIVVLGARDLRRCESRSDITMIRYSPTET